MFNWKFYETENDPNNLILVFPSIYHGSFGIHVPCTKEAIHNRIFNRHVISERKSQKSAEKN